MFIFMRARIDSAQMRVSQAAVGGAEPELIVAGWQPELIVAGSHGSCPSRRSALSLHLHPLRMNTSCTPSFQTGGAFTRSPPIGALVEPPRLRPAG